MEWGFHKTVEISSHLKFLNQKPSEEPNSEGIYNLEQELRVMSSGLSFGEGHVGKANWFLSAVSMKKVLDFLSCNLKLK